MYILKNAITSIKRNKGRNLLIGLIIMVIAIAVTVTLAINNTATSLIKAYKDKYQVEASITVNRENMMKDFNPNDRENSKSDMKDKFNLASSLTETDIKNYADSKYVKSYYYTSSVKVNSNDLEKAKMSSNNDMSERKKDEDDSSSFEIKGYSSYDAMNEFISGSYKITDGEIFTDFTSNNCLINSELATINNLKVGDTISFTDDNSNTYQLVISAIFEEASSDNKSMFSSSANTIITSSSFINKMSTTNSELKVSVNPTFILTSKDVVDKFSSELTSKGLDKNLMVTTNLESIDESVSTISNVKTFAVTFLVITLIIGAAVLLIINMINIRERKYEIGVLRTIGMKKTKVCLQFILELLIVALASLLLGAGIGSFVSVPISNKLLANEIATSKTENNNIRENFGKNDKFNDKKFNGVARVEAFDSINATVDVKVLLELLALGLSLTLISSISATVSIQKFSPLTILKERS
mgnify:FL=1